MAKFYFTYGDNPGFPYRNGWTEVIAEDRKWAVLAFEKVHSKRPGSTLVNCAMIYSEWEWETTMMAATGENFGHGCHEIITMELEHIGTIWAPDKPLIIERKEAITFRCEYLDG